MAVGAYHLTLFEFTLDAWPVMVVPKFADRRGLVAQVVELQHERIVCTAIRATPLNHVIKKAQLVLFGNAPLAILDLSDVAFLVALVVRGVARAA